jgi:hypothetical protein
MKAKRKFIGVIERDEETGREFKVSTYGCGGLLPGVNLDDTSALLDIMEPPEEFRKKLMG